MRNGKYKMQFGFMPGKGTTNAVFNSRMQEGYRDKKIYISFMDIEKVLDGVPKNVIEWSLRKKGVPEIMVRAAMSLNRSKDES